MTMYTKTIKHLLRLVTLQRKIYYPAKTHPAIVYTSLQVIMIIPTCFIPNSQPIYWLTFTFLE